MTLQRAVRCVTPVIANLSRCVQTTTLRTAPSLRTASGPDSDRSIAHFQQRRNLCYAVTTFGPDYVACAHSALLRALYAWSERGEADLPTLAVVLIDQRFLEAGNTTNTSRSNDSAVEEPNKESSAAGSAEFANSQRQQLVLEDLLPMLQSWCYGFAEPSFVGAVVDGSQFSEPSVAVMLITASENAFVAVRSPVNTAVSSSNSTDSLYDRTSFQDEHRQRHNHDGSMKNDANDGINDDDGFNVSVGRWHRPMTRGRAREQFERLTDAYFERRQGKPVVGERTWFSQVGRVRTSMMPQSPVEALPDFALRKLVAHSLELSNKTAAALPAALAHHESASTSTPTSTKTSADSEKLINTETVPEEGMRTAKTVSAINTAELVGPEKTSKAVSVRTNTELTDRISLTDMIDASTLDRAVAIVKAELTVEELEEIEELVLGHHPDALNQQEAAFVLALGDTAFCRSRWLNKTYPKALKMGLSIARTPFLNGNPVTFFYDRQIYPQGGIAIAFERLSSFEALFSGIFQIAHLGLEYIAGGRKFTVTKASGNIILEVDNSEGCIADCLNEIVESERKCSHRERSFFASINERVIARIIAGDPLQARLALDTSTKVSPGDTIQILRETGVSVTGDQISDTGITFNCVGEDEIGQERVIAGDRPGLFFACSTQGIMAGTDSGSSWFCDARGSSFCVPIAGNSEYPIDEPQPKFQPIHRSAAKWIKTISRKLELPFNSPSKALPPSES